MSNFMSIRSYFTIYFYFLYIILNNKNLKFRDLSDDLFIDIWSFWKFSSIEDLRKKKCNLIVDLPKFTSNKKRLSGVVILIYNQVCC